MHAIIKKIPALYAKFRNHGDLKKIAFNAGWLFLDKIVRMGVGLIVGVWVARFLGPEQFGMYNYAQAFVFLFSPLITLGLDGIVVRDIVNKPEEKEEILGTAFTMRIVGAALTLGLSVTAISLIDDDPVIRWLVGIVAVGTIFQTFDTIDLYFQTKLRSKLTVYAKNIAFLLTSVMKVILILTQAPLLYFAWVGSLEIAIGAAGLFVSYRMQGSSIRNWRANMRRARQLLGDSWPLILSGLVVMIYMRIDQIMIGQMLGQAKVGIYTAATKLSELWYFVPTAIVSSVAPSIIEAKKQNEELYYTRFHKTFVLLIGMAYAVAVPITFLADTIVRIMYGEAFQEAGPVLTIHIWSAVFVFLQLSTATWFINENQRLEAFLRNLAGAGINIALNLYTIPAFGVKGAAISTVFAYVFVICSPALFSRPYRRLFRIILKSLFLRKV